MVHTKEQVRVLRTRIQSVLMVSMPRMVSPLGIQLGGVLVKFAPGMTARRWLRLLGAGSLLTPSSSTS